MKPEEKVAERFLSEQNLGTIIYEPKGQRTPDFSINNEIGVEVRRLNKYQTATPLEKLQFDIIPKLESLFKSYYERSHTKSYFIMIDFKRPLKATKNVLGQVKSILDNHSEDMEGTCEYEVSDNLTIAIIPSTERFDHKFVFGSSTDSDRAGFTISDIIDSLNIIVPEKARIVEPHINDFKKWWLILVDHIGYVPVEIEMENLRKNFSLTHPFERIYLISPIDPKIGTFL